MPEIYDLENFKTIIQHFRAKDDVLYWYDRPIASRYENPDVSEGTPYFAGGPVISVKDGGTGVISIKGLIKGNGTDPFSPAVLNEDYITAESASTLKNKKINAAKSGGDGNEIININLNNFANAVISTDGELSDDSDYKLSTQRAIKHYVDNAILKQVIGNVLKDPVLAATTESIDLKTTRHLSTIDGVILHVGDRILVKDQARKFDNGIYVVQEDAPLVRAADGDPVTELVKCSVFVNSGETNRGTTWYCNNKTIVPDITDIVWMKISTFPIYYPGFGILIDVDSGIITLDQDQVLHRKMTRPVEIEIGGTNNTHFAPNSVVISGTKSENNLKSLSTEGDRRIVLSSSNGSPKWSELKYPDTINDRSFLYVNNSEILGIDFTPGFLMVNKSNMPVVNRTIPEYIKMGNDKEIYHQDGEDVDVTDGGTGISSISKDHFLYGYTTNKYKETPISQFGRDLLKQVNLEAAQILLELGPASHMDIGTEQNTVAAGNHTHEGFIRSDGTLDFTAPIGGIDPVLPHHLVTKQYVDALALGLKWLTPVVSCIKQLPTEVFIEDRYLIDGEADDPELLPYLNQIVRVIDRSRTLEIIPTKESNAVKALDTNISYISTGTNWIPFSSNSPHNALGGMQGGHSRLDEFYHLSESQFKDLTGRGIARIHKHYHDEMIGIQGGDGIGAYHLTREEYASIRDLSFKHHNMLFGVQGGESALEEFFHLSADQHQQLTGKKITDLHRHLHSDSPDINGSTEGYHLSEQSYKELVTGSPTNIHKHYHNLGLDIQGGNEAERYHLDREYYDIVMNLKNLLISSHNSLKNMQGGDSKTGDFYHLTRRQYDELTNGNSTEMHRHDMYIKRNGTVAFLASPDVPVPTKDTHIATKGYVDTLVSTGIRWSKPVLSMNFLSDTELTTYAKGERYIVKPIGYGEWENRNNAIVEWIGTEWQVYKPEDGTALLVKDKGTCFVWRESLNEWVEFIVKQDHNSLTNLEGGANNRYFHLSAEQYNALVGGEACSTHYHPDVFIRAEGILTTYKGGTGISLIPKGTILYAKEKNDLVPMPIGNFFVDLMQISDASDVRTKLDIKSMAKQDSDDVNITGGKITGIDTLGIDVGGTGLDKIPSYSILYSTDENKLEPYKVHKEGLELLAKSKDEIVEHLGIRAPRSLTDDSYGGRSRLFYLVAFGM